MLETSHITIKVARNRVFKKKNKTIENGHKDKIIEKYGHTDHTKFINSTEDFYEYMRFDAELNGKTYKPRKNIIVDPPKRSSKRRSVDPEAKVKPKQTKAKEPKQPKAKEPKQTKKGKNKKQTVSNGDNNKETNSINNGGNNLISDNPLSEFGKVGEIDVTKKLDGIKPPPPPLTDEDLINVENKVKDKSKNSTLAKDRDAEYYQKLSKAMFDRARKSGYAPYFKDFFPNGDDVSHVATFEDKEEIKELMALMRRTQKEVEKQKTILKEVIDKQEKDVIKKYGEESLDIAKTRYVNDMPQTKAIDNITKLDEILQRRKEVEEKTLEEHLIDITQDELHTMLVDRYFLEFKSWNDELFPWERVYGIINSFGGNIADARDFMNYIGTDHDVIEEYDSDQIRDEALAFYNEMLNRIAKMEDIVAIKSYKRKAKRKFARLKNNNNKK